jgi:hypothetical protein
MPGGRYTGLLRIGVDIHFHPVDHLELTASHRAPSAELAVSVIGATNCEPAA